jgi:hypothetical protein
MKNSPMRARYVRHLTTAMLTIIVAALTVGALPSFASATGSPTPLALSLDSAVNEDTGDVTGALRNFGPAVLESGGTLAATVDLENLSVRTAQDYEVRLAITRAPITSRGALAQFLDDPTGTRLDVVASTPVGTEQLDDDDEVTGHRFAPGTQTMVHLRASADDLRVRDNQWGVYGVTVLLVGGDAPVLLDTMAFTWMDAEVPTLPLSMVATVSGSATRVEALLTAADHPSVTTLIDPTVLTGMSAATADLSDREVYLLPAGNPDLTSFGHADNPRILEFAIDRAQTESPALLGDLPWLGLAPVLDAPTLAIARSHGATASMVEPRFGAQPPLLTGFSGRTTPAVADVTLPDSSATVPLIVPEAGLSDLVAHYRPAHPATGARLVAEAALMAADQQGPQPVVVSPGASWVVNSTEASAGVEALFNAPWVEPRSLASVLADSRRASITVPEVTVSGADVNPEDLTRLSNRLDDLERLANTTARPWVVMDLGTDQILNAVSLHGRSAPGDREAAVNAAVESLNLTVGSLSLTPGSALNLVAATGNVPVTVRNDLPVDSTVTVVMTSLSPHIDVASTPEVTIPAGSQITVLIPVTAVSSANVSVFLALENAQGDRLTDLRTLDIRVRADWGNAVTAVFTVGLVLLLIAGLIRTIRRGRKDTRTGPGEQAALAEPHPEEADRD